MTLRIGCSTGAFFPSAATESAIDRAADLRVYDIEIMLQTHGEYQSAFFEVLRRRATASGASVHAVHTLHRYHPIFDDYPRRVDEGWDLFSRAIEGAASIGAGVLVWHGACRGHRQLTIVSNEVLEAVDRLAGLCADAGISLALENVAWCAMSQTRDVLAFASRLPELRHSEAIGFVFDPFQASDAKANPFMILAAMEPRLLDVHLRDYRESESNNRELVPGNGDLPWPALIRAIASTGYAGPMMLEGSLAVDGPETIARVRRLLDPLIESTVAPDQLCDAPLPEGVLEGIRLFNQGQFYECHEEIEHEWHAERGPVRQLYQGILQIGVGFHHIRGGNQRGAVLLLTDGIAKVSGFLPICRGVDTGSLVMQSQRCLDMVASLSSGELASFDWDLVPVINVQSPATQEARP
jgi:sugar phosphate isomerase/epimerase/predicted metal-dependent hydrolase